MRGRAGESDAVDVSKLDAGDDKFMDSSESSGLAATVALLRHNGILRLALHALGTSRNRMVTKYRERRTRWPGLDARFFSPRRRAAVERRKRSRTRLRDHIFDHVAVHV